MACSLPFEWARASKRAEEDTCSLAICHKAQLISPAVRYLPFGVCSSSRWASEIISVQKLNQLLKTDLGNGIVCAHHTGSGVAKTSSSVAHP